MGIKMKHTIKNKYSYIIINTGCPNILLLEKLMTYRHYVDE